MWRRVRLTAAAIGMAQSVVATADPRPPAPFWWPAGDDGDGVDSAASFGASAASAPSRAASPAAQALSAGDECADALAPTCALGLLQARQGARRIGAAAGAEAGAAAGAAAGGEAHRHEQGTLALMHTLFGKPSRSAAVKARLRPAYCSREDRQQAIGCQGDVGCSCKVYCKKTELPENWGWDPNCCGCSTDDAAKTA